MALWTIARQAPLSMGFSRREYWSGESFPPPEDLPDPVIKPVIPTWKEQSLLLSHLGFMDLTLHVGCSVKFFTCISSFSLIKILCNRYCYHPHFADGGHGGIEKY